MSVSKNKNFCFLDTNIWLYAFLLSEDEQEQKKSTIAKNLIKIQDIVISTQVINEVCVNLIRKSILDEQRLSNLIISFYSKYKVVAFNCNILLEASQLRNQYNFSYWDSLIIASALSVNAQCLYSEDMQHGLIVSKKLEIINPFLTEN